MHPVGGSSKGKWPVALPSQVALGSLWDGKGGGDTGGGEVYWPRSTGQGLGSFRVSLEASRASGEGPHDRTSPWQPLFSPLTCPYQALGLRVGGSASHGTNSTFG